MYNLDIKLWHFLIRIKSQVKTLLTRISDKIIIYAVPYTLSLVFQFFFICQPSCNLLYFCRVAASQLATLGCPELIARSRDEYQDIAIRLGTDREYLKALRAKVWKARVESPLFDCSQYAKGLENLFSRMWKRFQRNELPDHISSE